MADEPVDNVGNICIQIFLRIIRVISMKKIFLNGKMEDNLKEIDNKIYIVRVYTKRIWIEKEIKIIIFHRSKLTKMKVAVIKTLREINKILSFPWKGELFHKCKIILPTFRQSKILTLSL